jgi:protein-L-isoaspartate(D-aspartate) O-methyltransferase
MVEAQLRRRGVTDARVLEAMGRVPRHEFVSTRFQRIAYGDHPIPIAENQTISQPCIVGLMLQALALEPHDRVLEVGTGSGYEAALLAELARQVYSIERHSVLSASAAKILARLGYHNVVLSVGDGSRGLPCAAPFNAIVVSAAAASIPPALLEQLENGGRMVIPVGSRRLQELQLVRKGDCGPVVSVIGMCCFVPLIEGTTSAALPRQAEGENEIQEEGGS